MESDEEDIILETDDVVDNDNDTEMIEPQETAVEPDDNYVDIGDVPEINITETIIEPSKRISKNKLTRYEFVRIIGERLQQLTKGAKPLIKQAKGSEELTYKEIAIEELKANMIPFKIRRFVKDHYEIWKIEELNKKHLEPLFY